MQLREIQQQLTQVFFSNSPENPNSADELSSIFSRSNISIDNRLKVYRNHIAISLGDVLVSHFPFVKALAGEEFLEQATQSYLLANPPREACLDRYGAEFPDFLESASQTDGYPFISDAAKLDWLMIESANAIEENTLTMAQLADRLQGQDENQYGDTILKLKESTRLLHSRYPLDKMYSYAMDSLENNESADSSREARGQLETLADTEDTWLVVARPGWEPHIFRLEASDYDMLNLLGQNISLGNALEVILEKYPAFDFSQFWQNYLKLGLFAADNLSTNSLSTESVDHL